MLNELEKFAEIFDTGDVKICGSTTSSIFPDTTLKHSLDLSFVTGRPMQLRLALLTPNAHDLHQVCTLC